MLRDNNVYCEGCNKTLVTSGDLSILGDELEKAGWGWLRGDEAYDHYCSRKCAKVVKKRELNDYERRRLAKN